MASTQKTTTLCAAAAAAVLLAVAGGFNVRLEYQFSTAQQLLRE